MSEELYWDDATVGDQCITPSVMVTEAMVNAYAELTGDFTPVHVDEEYAKTTPFGTSIGTLEVGKGADMVLLDWESIAYPYLDEMTPTH